MKNHLLSFLFLLVGLNAFAQDWGINQNLGNANTLVSVPAPGGLRANFVNGVFSDTTVANQYPMRLHPGAQIVTTTGIMQLWLRNANATAWIALGSNVNPNDCYVLLNGGIVTWTGSGLVMDVSPADYRINCTLYHSVQTQVTLSAAHASLPRIDVICVNTSSQVVVITGTPNANPVKPQVNPMTQLELTQVLVPAASSIPGNFTQYIIYDENLGLPTEWNTSTTGTVNFNNTVNPFHLTKAADATNGLNVIFTTTASVSLSTYSALKFYLRLKTPMPVDFFYVYATSVNPLDPSPPIPVLVNNGQYGFSSTITGAYQIITVPISAFNSSSPINKLTFSFITGCSFYLDYVQLQTGGDGGAASTGWSLTGNAGTTPGANYLGTTDANGIAFRFNNKPAGRIDYLLGGAGNAEHVGNVVLGGDALAQFDYTQRGGIIAIGPGALHQYLQDSRGELTAVGIGALRDNKTSWRNTVFGEYAMFQGWSGDHNAAFGAFALETNSGAFYNSAFGSDALRSNKMGWGNSGFGYFSLLQNTTGIDTIILSNHGTYSVAPTVIISAPEGSTPGSTTVQATATAVLGGGGVAYITITEHGKGYSSEKNPVTVTLTGGTGSGAVVGSVTLKSGEYNTGAGFGTLTSNQYGSRNVAIGYLAGYGSGNEQTFLDDDMSFLGSNASRHISVSYLTKLINGTAVGDSAKVGQSNTIVLGDSVRKTGTVIGSSFRDINSLLDLNSTDRYVLFPRMTGTQMGAITPVATGAIVYCTDSLSLCLFYSAAWHKLSGATGGGGGGTLTSVATTAPLGGGTITTTGTLTLDTTTLSGGWHSLNYYNTLYAKIASVALKLNISDTATMLSPFSHNPLGTANRITVTTNRNPVIDISASYVGQTSLTTLGTVTTGTWNGTAIATTYGGAPSGGTTGQVLTKNSNTGYDYSWATAAAGITTVGAFSGSSIANGASISGNTITFGPADGTNPGMVIPGAQTFGTGLKTFNGNITVGATTATYPTLIVGNSGTKTLSLIAGVNGSILEYDNAGGFVIVSAVNASVGTGAGAIQFTVRGDNGNVNIGTTFTDPGYKLRVESGNTFLNGDLRFAGALLPDNDPGIAGYGLASAGPGLVPTWVQFTTLTQVNNLISDSINARGISFVNVGDSLNLSYPSAGFDTIKLRTIGDGIAGYTYVTVNADSSFQVNLDSNKIHLLINTWGVPLSSLTAATGSNSINNALSTQTWNFNSNTTTEALLIASTSKTTGALVHFDISGTAMTNSSVLRISSSGANGSSLTTAFGLNSVVTNTGTTSTNTAVSGFASGGTLNFGGVFTGGQGGSAGSGAAVNALGDILLQQGNFLIDGSSSGRISIKTQAAAGTYNLNLPITSGSSGDLLTSQGGGSTAMTWTSPGMFKYAYTAQTTTYAILTTDYAVNCTSGTFTATLPTAVGAQGKVYVIKNSGIGTITAATTSAQTIDGSTTQSITAGNSLTVMSTGANWIII